MILSHFKVLAISPKEGFTVLYVTDYTLRQGLARVAVTIINDPALKGRVLKITLHDEQAKIGNSLMRMDFIRIRNLRLEPIMDELSGRLKGDQQLIMKLHPQSGSKELIDLIKYVFKISYASRRILMLLCVL